MCGAERARGSRSPETQSQLRKGRSGARGSRPGCPLPLRAARTLSPAGAVLGPAGACGADRAGLGVGNLGCTTPQRPARGNLTRDPRPDRPAGTASNMSPDPDPSSLPNLLYCRRCPSPHPELRDAQDPLDPQFGPWNPGPLDLPPPTLRLWSLSYRDDPDPWEWVYLSVPHHTGSPPGQSRLT